jgi:hypothetical protein
MDSENKIAHNDFEESNIKDHIEPDKIKKTKK